MDDNKFNGFMDNETITNPLDHTEIMNVNGKPYTVKSTRWKKNGNEYYEERMTGFCIAADGRILPIPAFTAKSWTGLSIPQDKIIECKNPFDLHAQRTCYEGQDGFLTDLLTPLCIDCLNYYKGLIEHSESWHCLWGLLYKPDPL